MARIKAEKPEPPKPLKPVATFVPGTITLYIPEHSPWSVGGKSLAPHYLTREDAEKIRDSLNKALEHEAAVQAVLKNS